MFRTSIRRKIVGIAMGLVVLMVATSVLSMVMASKVGHLLDELSNKYILAYGHLARANIRSLERSLALRRMVIMKMQNPPDEAGYARNVCTFTNKPSIKLSKKPKKRANLSPRSSTMSARHRTTWR
jgi:adenylate cyclase